MSTQRRRAAVLLELVLLVILVVGFAGLSAWNNWLTSLDRLLYDRVVTLIAGEVPDDVVVVGIDEQSLQQFGRWPWPRQRQAELLTRIAATNPRSVLVDIVYSDPSTASADERLAEALAATPDLALPIVIDALSSAGQLLEVLPLPEFLDATKALGHVHTELDDDGISRGVHLFHGIGEPHWPHLALALDTQQRALDLVPVASCETPSFSIQNIRCDYRRVPFVGEPGSFATLSAADILSGNHPAEVRAALVGKTVLVGLTATGVSDWVTTPVSGRSRPMAGVEFNANVLAAVRQGTLIEDAPRYVGLLLVLILALVPPLVLPRLPPGSMLLATIAFVAVPVLVFYLLLYFVRLYVPLSSAAVAAALTYPLWSWRRLEVAWRFVTQEIQRFSAERLQLGFTALDSNRLATVVAHVGTLLNARSDQEIFNADGEQQVVCREEHIEQEGEAVHRLVARVSHGRRRFQLSLARPDAFNDAEKAFVASVLKDTEHHRDRSGAPVERLNAQIRQLNQLADDVRTTRDVNMKSLEQITSGVCLISTGGLVEYVNTVFATLTGVQAEDNILKIADCVSAPDGRSWRDIIYSVVVQRALESFEAQSDDHRMLLDCAPLRLDSELKGYWLMSAVDVTEIRLVQRQREEALAFLSHDLRSPMVSILALIRSAEPNAGEDYSKGLLQQIERYAKRSLNVSEQFVQLSRVENSEDMDTYEVELGAIANNALEQVFEQADEKRITLELVDRVDDDGLWLKGNGELLERALVNLLTNAIKYSPERRKVLLQVGLSERGDAECNVIDEGYGIPAAELPHVFEPYYRSKVREIAVERGSGLGLRFVKVVTERHGGTVHVASEPSRGSTFTLRFPAGVLLDSVL